MGGIGSSVEPLRVAIVGSGPAGFYAAEYLLKQAAVVQVDMFERLPMPFGLVRFGVAPDHQKIKTAVRGFERVASHPAFRLFGNVEVGKHLTLDDLRRHYHAICFATGAQTDRTMGIPGEGLSGSHPATEFVAWYNGHPDYRESRFDLGVERAAVVGVGNVAVDVARILCRTPEELLGTDVADYALEALGQSRIKEVFLLGRRGPAQAAFTTPEVKELGELAGADVYTLPAEVALDPLSRAEVDASGDRGLGKKVEILQSLASRPSAGRPRRLVLRFLVSPVELIADASGRVAALRLVQNELYRSDDGTVRPRATDHVEVLPVGLVFRSVGYLGVEIPGLPFDHRRGVVPNVAGRVTGGEGGEPLRGIYVAGWIKRGPTGVIGTNKPDGAETAGCILEDAARGALLTPEHPDAAAALRLVRACRTRVVSFEDWRRLDRIEIERGAAAGRPRLKLTSREEVERVLAGE